MAIGVSSGQRLPCKLSQHNQINIASGKCGVTGERSCQMHADNHGGEFPTKKVLTSSTLGSHSFNAVVRALRGPRQADGQELPVLEEQVESLTRLLDVHITGN